MSKEKKGGINIPKFVGGINQIKLMIDKAFEVFIHETKNKNVKVSAKFYMQIL